LDSYFFTNVFLKRENHETSHSAVPPPPDDSTENRQWEARLLLEDADADGCGVGHDVPAGLDRADERLRDVALQRLGQRESCRGVSLVAVLVFVVLVLVSLVGVVVAAELFERRDVPG
jgi:hypothetical protein